MTVQRGYKAVRLSLSLLAVLCLTVCLSGNIKAKAGILNYYMYNGLYYDYFDDNVVISDAAELFSSSEIRKLVDSMSAINTYAGTILITVDSNPYGSTEAYAEWLHEQFTEDNRQDSVLILIDMDNRYVIIDALGESASYTITGNVSDTITDNCYTYLGDGRYFEGTQKMFDQVLAKFEGRKFSTPVRYISLGLMSLAIGMFFSYAIAKKKYVITSGKGQGAEFSSIWNGDSRINPKKDPVWYPNVIYKTTKKTYSPVSSGSGGSGGGRSGGGGGGHSSGGHGF